MNENRELTWRHLKGLHELYIAKQTRAKIADNAYVRNYLISQKKVIRYKTNNIKILEARPEFISFYEQNFKDYFLRFTTFLEAQGLENDARKKYSSGDILTLMFIADHKDDLIDNLSTVRTFSNEIFKGKGSKYLENHPGLKNAVCKILGIDDFPERDPKNLQWRLVVDCINPTVVVLCENIAYLKSPWIARENNIELWYVGGNNIGIIDYISKETLSKPVYYSCDWDYHGLTIYSRIKEKLFQKSVIIKILEPYKTDVVLPVNSPYHNSNWKVNEKLSGLSEVDFTGSEKALIKQLIKDGTWIEEESLDLIELVRYNIL